MGSLLTIMVAVVRGAKLRAFYVHIANICWKKVRDMFTWPSEKTHLMWHC